MEVIINYVVVLVAMVDEAGARRLQIICDVSRVSEGRWFLVEYSKSENKMEKTILFRNNFWKKSHLLCI